MKQLKDSTAIKRGLAALTFSIFILYQNAIAAATPTILQPTFDGVDLTKPQIPINLVPVASGLSLPTDIQFIPDQRNGMVVLEKTGKAKLVILEEDKVIDKAHVLLEVEVNSSGEMGLLGLAFHPDFVKSQALVISYNPKTTHNLFSRISHFVMNQNLQAVNEKVILEVLQPYSNHKGGQVAFGPKRCLYIGFGDGGSGGDPHGNGQNMDTYLGKILRIIIDDPDGNKPYSIPSDNPFINKSNVLPEIWAYGLRNPWRFSFDNQYRLIVADVGQNQWEEIDIVEKGSNMGWNLMEGSHCYPPNTDCDKNGITGPIYEYDRNEGSSVIGGYVYNGTNKNLKGKYIFADFVSGRIWALDLPENYVPNKSMAKVYSLGRFSIAPSTFGRDPNGNVYVADINSGIIYKIN